eukprot:3581881-Ditylum_brightwellii.AAC.1
MSQGLDDNIQKHSTDKPHGTLQKKHAGKGAVEKLLTSSRHKFSKETLEAISITVNSTGVQWQAVI